MKCRGALAIFVKTPEFSPVKTRLAAGIGLENTLRFYDLALEATAALAKKVQSRLPNLDILWTVAEAEGLTAGRWHHFPTVYQGEGSLGQRLDKVYQHLLKSYDYVGFMGADSPHLPSEKLLRALTLTQEKHLESFVLGETQDGGFYFFGGGLPLAPEAWLHVEYSSKQTSQQLQSQLLAVAPVMLVDEFFDIDTAEDLKQMCAFEEDLLPEQMQLVSWVKCYCLI